MDILIYILELIKFRKEIGINGFGTIFKQKTPGRYDSEKHAFLPPTYVLSFTEEIRENGGLAQFISQKRNVSTETAQYFIGEYVETIQKSLQDSGEFDLGELGKVFSENGKLSFLPASKTTIGFDFFALPILENTINVDGNNPDIDQQPQASDIESNEVTDHENFEEIAEVEPARYSQSSETYEDTFKGTNAEELQQIDVLAIETPEHPENELEHLATPNEESEEKADFVPSELYASEPEQEKAEEEIIYENYSEENNPGDDAVEQSTESTSTDDVESAKKQEEEVGEIETITPSGVVRQQQEVPSIPEDNFHDEFAELRENFFNQNNQVTDKFDEPTAAEIDESPAKGRMPWYITLILIFVIIGLCLSAAYLINPKMFNKVIGNKQSNQKKNLPLIPTNNLKNKTDSLSFADSIMKNAEKVGLQVDSARDTIKVSATSRPVNTTTYEIISVAFGTQKEVDVYISRMKKRGIVAKAVPSMPGRLMKKVSIGTFNSSEAANKELDRLKKELKNNELYIFVNKQK